MKKLFATFLVLGLISTLSCLPSEIQRTRVESQRFFDLFGAITKIIDALVKTVQNKLNDLVNDTGMVILNGIANIEEAISQAISDFMAQAQNVKDQIDQLINDEIGSCLGDLNQKIVDVQNGTIQSIRQCYENGRNELDKISEFLSNYTEKNNNEIKSVKDKIQECIDEPNFGDKVKCAVDATTTIRDAIENYGKNIEETASGIFATITNSINGTFVCIENESNLGQDKLDEIVNEVIECIGNNAETTTRGNSETETTNSAIEETTQDNAEATTNASDDQESSVASENIEETTEANYN